MNLFGLIGFPLSHSFSKKYFTQRFEKQNIADSKYELFELEDIVFFPQIITENPNLKGLNVTIPHKQNVIPYLDELDDSAKKVGAVNVIKFSTDGKKIGFNSDYYGFRVTLEPWAEKLKIKKALVLGSGGASKAVQAVLIDLNIDYKIVSRKTEKPGLTYSEIDKEIMESHTLIVNTTPLGMYPNLETFPEIPYQLATKNHLFYDLVYNPEETFFMREGKANGANAVNGLQMLIEQAEKSWEIWNS